MAGIYVHIPFCKQACHYCDFHFSVSTRLKPELLKSMHKDIELNSKYLGKEPINTIYFGGGTPSLLESNELSALLDKVLKTFKISEKVEITVEANPDDLNIRKLKNFRSIGINRLSIGVQSFRNRDLRLMNRVHDADLAHLSIENVRKVGFKDINMDLIYGIPDMSLTAWENNLEAFLKYQLPHLSAYCLTFEDRTAFGNWLKYGKIQRPKDKLVIQQFKLLMDIMALNGYDHYEISNFAKPGFISGHNSAYWKGEIYLGLGPGAHSYNSLRRKWNVSNNALYIKHITQGEDYFEEEVLTKNDRFNEYVLTSLRTMWGCNHKTVAEKFGEKRLARMKKDAMPYLEEGQIIEENGHFFLTENGKFVADKIASDLFII